MRRFTRRRRSASSARGAAASIDAAHWMQRIVEEQIVPAGSLDPRATEEVPASYAAIGVGESQSGDPLVVAFAPHSGGDAVLAAVAAAGRLVEDEGFAGEVVAVAPEWSTAARRRLGLVGKLPYRFRAVAASSLADSVLGVQPESMEEPAVLAVSAIAGHLARPADRELFSRAVAALEGLASKHGGAVRGVGRSVELVLLARRVAELQADDSGVLLNTILPQRSSVRVSAEGLAGSLDALEGQLRKRLNDRRTREGEEGVRAAAIPLFRAWHSLRALVPWPLGGSDRDVLDLVGVDVQGRPVIAAARVDLTLESLGAILDASLVLQPVLSVVLSHAAGPVRLEAPRLMLAGKKISVGVVQALRALRVAHELFELRAGRDRPLELGVLGSREASEALTQEAEPVAESPASTAEGDEDAAGGARSHARRRGRRGRGGRGPTAQPKAEAEAGAEVSEVEGEDEVSAPLFEEVSLFDLDSDDEVGAARRKRGRSRRRGRRSSGEGEEGAAEEPASGELEEAAVQDRPRSSGRRRRRGRRSEVNEDEREVRLEDAADEIDWTLADIPEEVSELDGAVEVREEGAATGGEAKSEEKEVKAELEDQDDDLVEDAEEEAEESGEDSLEIEEESSPEAPRRRRRRAVILAHADRSSVIAATLLARDLRLLESLWVYPQEELMTFFRSVTTDLREQTPIYVVGFSASPVRDVLQAVSLYSDRLSWFDHHEWPPEDLNSLEQLIGTEALHVTPGLESSIPAVLDICSRRSRFSDKLVDLATGRFSQHDFERWGRLWWWRFGEIAEKTGDVRSDLEPLLAGRPSDLAKEAAAVELPAASAELAYVSSRDFRLVHFGGHLLVVVNVEPGHDTLLCSRIARERYRASLSLAYVEGDDLVMFAGEEQSGRRSFDLTAVVAHISEKLEWVEALVASDHVARFRVRNRDQYTERLDDVIGEIAMGRSILEG
jgi:hypothetical protein